MVYHLVMHITQGSIEIGYNNVWQRGHWTTRYISFIYTYIVDA